MLVKNFLYFWFFYIEGINPFDTSVLVCASQEKISKKNFFDTFWKVPYNLNLIWRMQVLNSFSHIFSSSFSFLPRLVKNILKTGQNFLFTDLHQNYHITQFWYGEFKIEFFSPYFVIFIFIFALVSQKWLKKQVKKFFLRFSWKFP